MTARILVADDEPDIVGPLEYALRGEGWDVAVVEDGDAALGRALAEPFDLVVLDVILPGLSGMEVCRRLRERSFRTSGYAMSTFGQISHSRATLRYAA